ncbi:MAG: DUF1016 N-terminal domain-containing protein [Treponema sp.]|nr:DUF1016 N-terminal domain-containing protein [Treponema sp.]
MLAELGKNLTLQYGRGFSERNLFNMLKLYEVFNNKQILHTLCAKLSWSHFCKLTYIEDDTKRDFYTTRRALEMMNNTTKINFFPILNDEFKFPIIHHRHHFSALGYCSVAIDFTSRVQSCSVRHADAATKATFCFRKSDMIFLSLHYLLPPAWVEDNI